MYPLVCLAPFFLSVISVPRPRTVATYRNTLEDGARLLFISFSLWWLPESSVLRVYWVGSWYLILFSTAVLTLAHAPSHARGRAGRSWAVACCNQRCSWMSRSAARLTVGLPRRDVAVHVREVVVHSLALGMSAFLLTAAE